jgi:hypothetical protein
MVVSVRPLRAEHELLRGARERGMKKISEYLAHAQECLDLASRARSPDERDMILKMAETWTSLAETRKRQLESDGLADQDN